MKRDAVPVWITAELFRLYVQQYDAFMEPCALRVMFGPAPQLTRWQRIKNRCLRPFREPCYRIGLAWRALRTGELE